jgi:hypothetical protein
MAWASSPQGRSVLGKTLPVDGSTPAKAPPRLARSREHLRTATRRRVQRYSPSRGDSEDFVTHLLIVLIARLQELPLHDLGSSRAID